MTSIDIILNIIKNNKLEEFTFYLIAHKTEINWRQENNSFEKKIRNISSGIKFYQKELIKIIGKDISLEMINNFSTKEKPIISLVSKILSPNNQIYHLSLMNLHIDYPITVKDLKKAISSIYTHEFKLLATDKYYHLYGDTIFSEKEWKYFNLNFLMTDILVSPRYIGHSLERGFNTLRLNVDKRIKKIEPYLTENVDEEFLNVKSFAISKHGNQRRLCGEMYYHHLLETYNLTKEILTYFEETFSSDQKKDILMAAILHDTIEDTYTDYEDILELTNEYVASLVASLSNDKRKNANDRLIEYNQSIELAGLDVHIIKLADIYSNILGINASLPRNWKTKFLEKSKSTLCKLNNVLKQTPIYINCIKSIKEKETLE